MSRHVQVQHRILQYIAENNLVTGDRLPPEKQLAPFCGVSVLTLRRSLDTLRRSGLIESRHGLGNFIKMNLHNDSGMGKILFLSLGKTSHLNDYRFFASLKYIAGQAGFTADYWKEESEQPTSEFLKKLENFFGVIVYGYMFESWLNVIRGASCPVALVPERIDDFGFPAVNLDVEQGARLLVREFLARGIDHFIFPFICRPGSWGSIIDRAVVQELKAHGISETNVGFFNLQQSVPPWYNTLQEKLLAAKDMKAAIFCNSSDEYSLFLNLLLEQPELRNFYLAVLDSRGIPYFQGISLKRSMIVQSPQDEPWKTAFSLLMNGAENVYHKIPFTLITKS